MRRRVLWAALCGVIACGLAPRADAQRPPPPATGVSDTLPGESLRQLRLEAIEIEGNKRTKDQIILSRIGLEPGDAVDVETLEAARRRLVASDYFTEVDLYTRPGTARGRVVLVVEVEERSFPSFETGFGYDNLHGWFLTLLGLRFDNALGVESRLRLGWRLGFRISGLDAEYTKPISEGGGLGLDLRVAAYQQRHLFYGSGPATNWQGGEWLRFDQKIARLGAEGSLRFPLGRASDLSLGIHAEVVDPDSTFTRTGVDGDFRFSELPPTFQAEAGKQFFSGFFLRFIRDTRGDPFYPRTGSFTLLTATTNTSLLGSDAVFTTGVLDFRKHIPLATSSVLSGRLNGGLIAGDAPYYDRFYIGGIYSIRGFEEWSLSPTDGDEGFWTVNTEFRFPLTRWTGEQPRLTGLLFFDAGQGWQRDDISTLDDVQAAAGYGVRLRLPWLGTLGIDVGIPFTDGRTGDKVRVHALLGFSF